MCRNKWLWINNHAIILDTTHVISKTEESGQYSTSIIFLSADSEIILCHYIIKMVCLELYSFIDVKDLRRIPVTVAAAN